MRGLSRLSAAAVVAMIVCLVLAYLQWRINENCVIPGVCITDDPPQTDYPDCKELTCGFTLWAFAGPAIGFGVLGYAASLTASMRRWARS